MEFLVHALKVINQNDDLSTGATLSTNLKCVMNIAAPRGHIKPFS